jgi:putative flavoprotein involved in K+ transport
VNAQLEVELAGRHFPVVVVGAGQAGLSMSYLLERARVQHVVLERHRLAHAWRSERWDSFCLVTPNWQCQLPGHPYAGADPHGFMLGREIVDYLEQYARASRPPLYEGVEVSCVTRAQEPSGAPRFSVRTSAGAISADQIVVATGAYHDPLVPAVARDLPGRILQLHSRDYKRPQALPQGDVLVVGSGQSGAQIAEDLLIAGRTVHLSVGSAPRCARRHRGKDVVEWLQLMGHYELPVDRHPKQEQVRDKTNHYVTGRDGGRDIDLRQLALSGMRLYGSFSGLDGTRLDFQPDLTRNLDAADAVYVAINRSIDAFIAERGIDAPPGAEYIPPWAPACEPRQLDLDQTPIGSVIWAIGFRANFSWLQLPIFDARGRPRHERGVTEESGLYFLGLPWQYTWGSGRFSGVGRDAEYLIQKLLAHMQAGPPAARQL